MRRRIVGITVMVLATGMAGLLLASAGATADEAKRGGASSLKVDVDGPSKFAGKVVSTPSGIDCPEQKCVELVEPGVQYTLTATANEGFTFAGFTGACESTTATTCTLTTVEGTNLFVATFANAPAGDDACDKAKEKLAKAKKKLAELRADDASDSRIDSAVKKVKKAKKKKKEACAA